MLRKAIAIMVIAGFVSTAASADAAMMAYLTLKGQKAGQVRGSITQKGREDSIGVIALEQATVNTEGRLRVGQLMITKEVDRSSPVLRQMLDNQELVTEALIRFYTPQMSAATGVGAELQYYTLRLRNARIVSLKTIMENIRHADLQKYAMHEDVAFTYERAEWIWMDGGITAVEMGGAEQVK